MAKSKLSNTVCDEVKKHFPKHVYSTVIQRLIKIAEAPSEGAPTVLLHRPANDSKGKGSLQYWTFAKEFHQRVEQKRREMGISKTNRLRA